MDGATFNTYVLNKFIRTDKTTQLYEATTDTIALMRIKFNADNYKEEAYLAGISTSGDYKLGVPTDFGQIIGLVRVTETDSDQDYPNLNKISKLEFDERYPDSVLTSASSKNLGVPRDFCVYAQQILIGPVPDKTTYRYYINYTTEDATDVDASTDPVPFTAELRHRNVLRNGVLFELNDGLENFEEASYYKSLFLDGLNDIILQEARNTDSGGLSVRYNGI
jgi:hypothetical protein